jgi:hypothetical protein
MTVDGTLAPSYSSPTLANTVAVTNGSGVGSNGNITTKTRTARISDTFIISNSMLNEGRFGWFKDRRAQDINPLLAPPNGLLSGLSVQGQSNLGVSVNLPNVQPSEDRYQYADSLSWTKGAHQFKFGLDIADLRDTENALFNGPGSYTYGTITAFAQDLSGVTNGKHWQTFTESFGPLLTHASVVNYAVFAQDQWSVSRRLTINYGLRTDQTNIPSYRPENPGIKFSFSEKLAPRLGFAFDPKGDGKWKTYGSWGTFYDIEKLEMPRGSFGADHWLIYYWTLDDANWPAIDCDGTPASKCPGTFIEQLDNRHVSNGQGADNLIDPNLKPYKSEEVTFGLDHEIGRRMSIGTRFTHKWIDMAIEDVGTQVPGVGEVFYLANPGYGLGEFPLGKQFPATPKPKRHYDGLEFTFDRRLDNRWFMKASLLISRTWGSYSGLTSSDENGRNSPGVNRFYDGLYMSFDQNAKPVYGRLQSDRPWVVKIQPAYILPWGTQAGAEIDVESGVPQSSTVNFAGTLPVFVNGRGDLGRAPVLSYMNLNFRQEFRLPGTRYKVLAALNIDNLFYQMTVTTIGTTPYRDTMTFPQCTGGTSAANRTCADTAFFAGFNAAAVMAQDAAATANTGRPNVLYKQPSGYQGARSGRFQLKFTF